MSFLLPVPVDRRAGRVAVLMIGLCLYGASAALMLRSELGVMPWTVLAEGLSGAVGARVGTWSILIGALVLLAWVPLRQRPGIGTIANVVVVGSALNAVMDLTGVPEHLAARWALLLLGIVLNGVATGIYVGAGLGPGPRDGLSLGLAVRTSAPLRVVRTGVELVVLGLGWVLGGTVGPGTLVYAIAIGPLMHLTVPALRLRTR